jgi:hypothetical protein
MARSTKASSPEEVSGSLFDESPVSVSVPRDLDVTFAKFLKHERLDGRSLFEGFETLRAVTYSSSAGFIRDLFGSLQEIEVIFGSDISIKGDLARLTAAQQAGVESIKDEFGRAGKKLVEMLKENRLGSSTPTTRFIAKIHPRRRRAAKGYPRFRQHVLGRVQWIAK